MFRRFLVQLARHLFVILIAGAAWLNTTWAVSSAFGGAQPDANTTAWRGWLLPGVWSVAQADELIRRAGGIRAYLDSEEAADKYLDKIRALMARRLGDTEWYADGGDGYAQESALRWPVAPSTPPGATPLLLPALTTSTLAERAEQLRLLLRRLAAYNKRRRAHWPLPSSAPAIKLPAPAPIYFIPRWTATRSVRDWLDTYPIDVRHRTKLEAYKLPNITPKRQGEDEKAAILPPPPPATEALIAALRKEEI